MHDFFGKKYIQVCPLVQNFVKCNMSKTPTKIKVQENDLHFNITLKTKMQISRGGVFYRECFSGKVTHALFKFRI